MYSEDPYLVGTMGVAALRGLQGPGPAPDKNHDPKVSSVAQPVMLLKDFRRVHVPAGKIRAGQLCRRRIQTRHPGSSDEAKSRAWQSRLAGRRQLHQNLYRHAERHTVTRLVLTILL